MIQKIRQPDSPDIAEAREVLLRAAESLKAIRRDMEACGRRLQRRGATAAVVGVDLEGEEQTVEKWAGDYLVSTAVDEIGKLAKGLRREARRNWLSQIKAYLVRDRKVMDISTGYHGINWRNPKYLPQLVTLPGYAEAVKRIEAHRDAGHDVGLTWVEVRDGRVRRVVNLRLPAPDRKTLGESLPDEVV